MRQVCIYNCLFIIIWQICDNAKLILVLVFTVHPLNKLPYGKLDSKSVGIREGVVFLTYSSLIASSEKGKSRLSQLVQWCGGRDFDGLVVFDEVLVCGPFHYCSIYEIDVYPVWLVIIFS